MKMLAKGILIMMLFALSGQSIAKDENIIDIFFKNRPPSQKVMGKLKPIMEKYQEKYEVKYHLITDEKNAEIIKEYGLPTTHFPVAVVINGKFRAKIDDKIVHFVHFPKFMEGIGRHEGDWSIDDVIKVLDDNSLLMEENILPELEPATSECQD
ncbi:MAG: hypothetical protein ACLFSQ_10215 [Candidatus Zixiibacteriota bacterium]